MKKIITMGIALLLMSLQCYAADSTDTPNQIYANNEQAPKMMEVIVFSDPQKQIMVTKDQPGFVIRLKSNRTTGYGWAIKKFDSKRFHIVEQKYVAPNSKLAGAGGYQEWKFMAKPNAFAKPSVTTIKMVYKRPWEKTSAKVVVFKVIVR